MQEAHREKQLFDQALDLATAVEREAFLRQACRDDGALLRRLQELLAAHEVTTAFLPQAPRRTLAVVPEELPEELPGALIGRYKILERIGEGGCGVVYVAEQTEPVRRRVALKVIKLGMDTKQVVARFEAERQALAMMDHPNIAKVLDAGATELGRPYFVMELVRGIPITSYCDQNSLNTQARLDLFIKVCQAIQHAHQKGIIHRDIKPSNILVTVNDGQPVPKVIDFGIAKATEGRLTDSTVYTQLHQFIGTPAYMSPEQAEMTSLDIDTRSDIYSLGVLLYELLSGRTPFDPRELMAAGLDAMRKAIREKEPARPSTKLATMQGDEQSTTAKRRSTEVPKLVRQIEGDLDWIVLKCLEKDRTRRYETANGLAADLTRHLTNEPVLARPPSTAYRFQKAYQRNRTAFAVAALFALVLVSATAFSAWQARIAKAAGKKTSETLALVTAERDAKEQARKEAETIATFLTQVFQSPDPARDGRTITVAEILGKAAQKLDTDLAAQPAQRAKLQATLATTFGNLGLHEEAVSLAEKVRDYHLATFGPEHPDTLREMRGLAYCYFQVGRRDEALQLREEVTTRFIKVLGPEHPEVLHSMNYLAFSYYVAGRLDEALKLQEKVLPLHRKVNGPEHPDTLQAMTTLALSFRATGRRDEALRLQLEVVPLSRKAHGPEHPVTLQLMRDLSGFYWLAGRKDEALKIQEEVLALRRKVLGPEHPDTLTSMTFVTAEYLATGRQVEALKLGEELLSTYRKVNITKPDKLAELLLLMGACYDDADQPEKVIAILEEALPLLQKDLGAKAPNTTEAMITLAKAYFQVGRSADGQRMLEGASGGDAYGLGAVLTLASLRLWEGDSAGYAALRDRWLPLAVGTNNWFVAELVAKLACLQATSETRVRTNALALARLGVELGAKAPALPWFRLALGMAEFRNGDLAEAEATFAEAARSMESAAFVPPAWRESIPLPTVGFYRAMISFQRGEVTEARKRFAEAEAKMKPLPADEKNPMASGADPNILTLWLAYKEAKALLNNSAPAEP
jgi:eukaryotic-like serine/threonine-protein kinase